MGHSNTNLMFYYAKKENLNGTILVICIYLLLLGEQIKTR